MYMYINRLMHTLWIILHPIEFKILILFIQKKNKNFFCSIFLFNKEKKLLEEVMFFIFYWLKSPPIKLDFSHLSLIDNNINKDVYFLSSCTR
jgi:hypothetical protein